MQSGQKKNDSKSVHEQLTDIFSALTPQASREFVAVNKDNDTSRSTILTPQSTLFNPPTFVAPQNTSSPSSTAPLNAKLPLQKAILPDLQVLIVEEYDQKQQSRAASKSDPTPPAKKMEAKPNALPALDARENTLTFVEPNLRNPLEESVFVFVDPSPTISASPLKHRCINTLNFEEEPKLNSEDGNKATKKGCAWYVMPVLPMELTDIEPDSYVVIKDKGKPCEIYYFDAKKIKTQIQIKQADVLEKIFANKLLEKLDKDDKKAIEDQLIDYRKNVQDKKIYNTNALKFFKLANPKSAVVETTAAAFCNLIDPKGPKARVVTKQNGDIVGVLSDALLGFVPVKDDPLKDKDLEFSIMDILASGYNKITELDALNKGYTDADLATYKDEQRVGEITVSTITNTKKEVTAKDLRNYRTIERLAISITSGYMYEENDLTRNNLGKKGRIDWELSLHTFSSKFKENKYLLGGIGRSPNADSYTIHRDDIINLPIFKYYKTYYFPGNPTPVTAQVGQAFVRNGNPYSNEENLVYEKLSKHPVFIYHKYKTLLKGILMDERIHHNIAKLHIPNNDTFRPLLEGIPKHAATRMARILEELLTIDDFNIFLGEAGNYVFQEIKQEIAAHNAEFGYDLRLMSDAKREPGKIYLKDVPDGLQYEVMGLDGILKNHIIPRNELPAGLPKNSPDIIKSRAKFLASIMSHTYKAGHTSAFVKKPQYADQIINIDKIEMMYRSIRARAKAAHAAPQPSEAAATKPGSQKNGK